MISIAQNQHYHNYSCIDRVGLGGGLILMWKDGITCDIASTADNIIHAHVKLDPSKPEVLFSFMYGSTYTDPKKKQWNFIYEFSEVVYQPWLVLGDLNFHLDKNKCSSDTWVQNRVRDAGLDDIGYEGKDYTWTSNIYGTGTRKATLDMGLGNPDWFLNFPQTKVFHLNHIASDHCPVLLVTKQQAPSSVDQNVRVKALTHDLENWYKIQTSFYKKKSRDKHILDMDNNTRYFHSLVNKRLHRNNINALLYNNDNGCKDRDSVSNLLTYHCSFIACTSNHVLHYNDFNNVFHVITDVDNMALLSIPSSEEIITLVKSMYAWSSRGPDSFQAGFYQSQRPIVGKDVTDVVQSFFETGFMPKHLNQTYICLIPKVKEPKKASDFRPIGLCHVIVHTMKHKEGVSGIMALKLDLSKAFDKLEFPLS
ncbi:uncharacterized protein LOC113315504 [Papaver somniferum]|uniref:uncharacterized protein LOC113315504 n=1 Tax=Papaver somniferum TaxID=3469 RepID=UPI000E705F6C|nr:uncharacterized protein LOC113315504 [Papaver somniferum]